MIFSLQFALIFAGYGAVSNLSGNYMERYTGADDFQLGLYFMIPHFLHIVRPFIGAQADRTQAHKKMYTWCALIAAFSYIPYILLPFLIKIPHIDDILTNSYRFWILAVAHIIGSIALNGCRTLADTLAKNYARRMKIEYVSLRKYAPVGLGLCGYFFGFVNEEWILPDYVPAMVLFSSCMLLLALVVHIWPEVYFVMMSSEDDQLTLPSTKQLLSNSMSNIIKPFKRDTSYVKQLESMTSYEGKAQFANSIDTASTKSSIHLKPINTKHNAPERKPLTVRQQLAILCLVLKRDFRISLAFIVLFFGGWICRSAQNFVFVQLENVCETKKTCHHGKLSGDVIAGISILEFLTYIFISAGKNFKINRLMLLQIALISLSLHYYFFAFYLPSLPSIWFLVESLHGFEFAIFITTSLSWGYSFANEVEYVIPELKEQGIISDKDDLNLVKVSLVATMLSCMTLLYEGFGSTLGSFVYGIVIERYTFESAWTVNGSIAVMEFAIISVCLFVNRFLKLKPKMCQLKSNSLRAKKLQLEAAWKTQN